VGNTEYSDPIQNIDISWISGKVNVVTWDGSTVKLEESGEFDNDDEKMRSRVDDGTLTVKFVKSGYKTVLKNVVQKELTLYIPISMSASIKDLKLVAASASLTVDGGDNVFSFNRIDVDTASGDVYLEGSFGSVTVDAASADVDVNGSVESLEVYAVSGRVDIDGELVRGELGAVSGAIKVKTYATAPQSLEVEAVSGNVELIIPNTEGGFVANLDSASGKMTCNGTRGDHYKSGAGVAKYDFESVSGNVTITAE
jgi:DUF4097 and DUF4098 domain-containing protein YvlB